MRLNDLMDTLIADKVKRAKVMFCGFEIYDGSPVRFPKEFNRNVTYTLDKHFSFAEICLDNNLELDTKTPCPEPETDTLKDFKALKVFKDKLKFFLISKVDDIDDCCRTLKCFDVLDKSPNIKSKVSDYLNGKQDAFMEILDFLVGLETEADKEEQNEDTLDC